MRTARHARRSLVAVFTATMTLTLMLSVARPTVPARAEDSQDVTISQAVAQAAETGQPVLATAETTETSSVVANPDGTLTATLGAGPLQEPDASSSTGWSPIDLSLQHGDGSYAPAVSAADTTFSDGGAGALATLDQGSTTYTENWDGTLPSPTVSGDTATYADVLANIDLVMTAQTTGFKQSFVVKAAPTSQLTLDVPLSLRGLTAVVDDNGNLIVTDAGGNTVATAGTAVMYGSAVDPSGEPTLSAAVDTAIVNGQHGPVFEISPDPSFFSNPELTYPVVIDPSPNLDVTNDTYVRQSTPTTSYLTDNGLKVGLVASSDIARALLKFPSVESGMTDGVDVRSATLNLYEADSGSCTASEIDLYETTSNWITFTPVNWNSQPTLGTLYASASFAAGHSGCSAAPETISTGGASGHTLADLVQSWADGSTNNGFELKAANESATTDYKKFRSSEYGSNSPTLTVIYSSPDYFYQTGFWFNSDRDRTTDPNSGTWLGDLARDLGHDYIQFSGASDAESGGVPWYWFHEADTTQTTIYCHTTESTCPGFPEGGSILLTYFDASRAFPSDDLDSQISIKDAPFGMPSGATVWFHHFCPPKETDYSNPWCDDNAVYGEWTAGSMTYDDYSSDGMDGCWYNNYNDLIPNAYHPYDAPNEGDDGTPSSFTAIRQWEVNNPNNDLLNRSLVIHLPDTSSEYFFPMVGSDSQFETGIPEGTILYLSSDAPIPEGATDSLKDIILALKTHGAVVGTTDTNLNAPAAEIDLENVAVDGYHDGAPQTWHQLGVDQDSLSSLDFSSYFYFSEAGGDGPSHQEWANDHGTKCESEPGQ